MTLRDFWLKECLMEGIQVDLDNKIVKFTDDSENYVDTSIENNPMYSNKAISIFQRKRDIERYVSDGNPLVYAMKGLKGWSISKEDLNLIWKRIDDILVKLTGGYDVIVIPESNSGLVSTFAEHISNRFNSIPVIQECLLKRTVEEVIDDINWKDFSDDERTEITDSFKKMGVYFEAKYFPKNLASKFESSVYKTNPKNKGTEIVNKNVLMIDDVVSSGMTLSHCANVINAEYFPKSLTNVVLFGEVS